MATKEKTLTPQQAKTFKQICELPRDNVGTKDFWLTLGVGEVTIAKQKHGEQATEMITMPRSTFEKFVRWYQTGITR
jgi:hypothetical protein